MQRPVSVTVCAWVIIALAVEAIAGSLTSVVRNAILSQVADPRVGVPVTAAMGVLVQIALIGCAIFMLRGANSARVTYVVLTAFVLIGVVTLVMRAPGLGFTAVYSVFKAAVLLYFLFRPEANAYFSGVNASERVKSATPSDV